MINVTEKERAALCNLYESASGNGFDFGFTDEIPSIARSARGGVVASLQKKGLIYAYADDDYMQFEFRAAFWTLLGVEADPDDERYPADREAANAAIDAFSCGEVQ